MGLRVDRVDYQQAVAAITEAARRKRCLRVAAANVHMAMEARYDAELANLLDDFELVVPDGQPIRWMLNATRRGSQPHLDDRVYGPELMRRTCLSAVDHDLAVFLYGTDRPTLRELEASLANDVAPGIRVAGALAPGFRESLWRDASRHCEAMLRSGASLLLVGLGCPRQERWVGLYGPQLGMPCLAVGAAFDLWARKKPQAPRWMQDHGFEWAFRLGTEPRRTWTRYARHNPRFILEAACQLAQHHRHRR